jgi:acyl-CoA dehydrogenase
MRAQARRDGGDWVLNGTKHFISHADIAGFTIAFMATGEEETPRGRKKLITAFFVDKGTQGFHRPPRLSQCQPPGLFQRGAWNLTNAACHAENVLGEVHKGFEVANEWLGATRLQVAATCLGRADRALGHALRYAAERRQFGQQIGKFQGVSFKLADMATGAESSRTSDMGGGLEIGCRLRDAMPIWPWPNSRRPKCWPWSRMRRSRSMAAWG